LRGSVDLSRLAELDVSEEQVSDLWSKARVAGVRVTIVGLETGGFMATIAGLGQKATETHSSAYLAGLRALATAEELLPAGERS